MWMVELATKTMTEDNRMGSQSADSSVLTSYCVKWICNTVQIFRRCCANHLMWIPTGWARQSQAEV